MTVANFAIYCHLFLSTHGSDHNHCVEDGLQFYFNITRDSTKLVKSFHIHVKTCQVLKKAFVEVAVTQGDNTFCYDHLHKYTETQVKTLAAILSQLFKNQAIIHFCSFSSVNVKARETLSPRKSIYSPIQISEFTSSNRFDDHRCKKKIK